MFRKKQVQGFCLLCFGLGLMMGCCLESWFFCSLGGLALIGFGMLLAGKK